MTYDLFSAGITAPETDGGKSADGDGAIAGVETDSRMDDGGAEKVDGVPMGNDAGILSSVAPIGAIYQKASNE